MKLTLDSAELVLLLAALRIDARAFIADSPLTMQDGARLAAQLDRARRSLFDRKLASVEPHRGLVPTPAVRALLTRAAKAAVGRDNPGARKLARISVCNDGALPLLHAILPDGMHVFATECNPADAVLGIVDVAVRRVAAADGGLLAARNSALRWSVAPNGGWLVRAADDEAPPRLFDRAGFAAHVRAWLTEA
jgi:hypothetical protein